MTDVTGGCVEVHLLEEAQHGACLACQLRGSLYVVMVIGQRMRAEGRIADFSAILMGFADLVSTGNVALVDQLMVDIMAVPCAPPAVN